MSLFERYKQQLPNDHCPTIAELARLIGMPVELVLETAKNLCDVGELSGIFDEDADENQDVAPEDVAVICNELQGGLPSNS